MASVYIQALAEQRHLAGRPYSFLMATVEYVFTIDADRLVMPRRQSLPADMLALQQASDD